MKKIAIAVLFAVAPFAHAHDIQWRHTFHLTQSAAFEVADLPGHVVGAGEGTGLGLFPADQVATMKLSYFVDFVKSEGPFTAYETYRFANGSTLSVQRTGSTTVDARSGVATLSGKFTFVGGSGTYAGIHGGGTFVGKRLNPLAAGADQYLDYTGSYELSTQ
ncbi:hypothetical protein [Ralstonia flaminis]|jgi:hypothetical protein|uniref:DUF3224 domain-containing protein n=1 Tax=Ralstonia flaminis TaxID=3058597 RepID=A0ABN9JPJ0_9RALS|nr:hypothetical protein [Ralstonia sp. LMG 18101]CAJ0820056.1 hypothetical protein LMG18101_04154 [Ralstonia sp. LMG 18101]